MSMKHLRFVVLALFVAVGSLSFAKAARAEIKVAVVDFQKIMDDSKAGQDLKKQIQTHNQSFQDELKKQEQSLQTMADQINKEQAGSKSASGDLIQKKADFEKKRLDAQDTLKKKGDTLQKAEGDAVKELQSQVAQVIHDLAEKDKYDLVLNRGTVFMAQQSMDITDVVVKQLDTKVQKIDLKL